MVKRIKTKKTKSANWTSLARVHKSLGSFTRRCTYISGISTGGGGSAVGVVGAALLRSSAVEWNSMAARFVEYRILAIRVSLASGIAAANANSAFVIFATDRSGVATTPTTPTGTYAFSEAKLFNGAMTTPQVIEYEARALDLEDQLFTPVGTTAGTYQVYFYIQGTSATQIYEYAVEFMVEFRGQQ